MQPNCSASYNWLSDLLAAEIQYAAFGIVKLLSLLAESVS